MYWPGATNAASEHLRAKSSGAGCRRDLSLLKISTRLRRTGDFRGLAIPSRSWRRFSAPLFRSSNSVFAAVPRWNLSLCPATSGDRPATTASRSAAAFIPRPAPVGVALPDLAAGHRRDGIGQAGNRGPMASHGLPAFLALAIMPSGTTQKRVLLEI